MKTSMGKTKLEIANGDITELEVDAIVVPASTELWMDHGVAAAIKRVGGEAVEKEAVLQGPVKVGEAVVTTGHDLKARWVIHVALRIRLRRRTPAPSPPRRGRRSPPRSAPRPAPWRSRRSVPAPARFPLYQCSSLMVGEVVAYLREHPRTSAAPRDALRVRRRGQGGVQARHGGISRI